MKVLVWVQRAEPDFREVRLLTVATRALVTAMTRSGVRRLHRRPEGLLRNGRRGGVEISRNHVGKNGARLC